MGTPICRFFFVFPARCSILSNEMPSHFKISALKNIDLGLIIILCIAGLVRYWGIHFGMECRPDEEQIVRIIQSVNTYFNPHTFRYPTFYKYIVLFFYGVYFSVGVIFGKHASMADFVVEFIGHAERLYFIDRYIAAFLGTATVFVVYRITKKMFDKRTAIIASIFMSLAYLHVRDSHFGVTDVPMTFFIMCFVLFLEKSYRDKSLRSYVISGILAGMATSTKYPGVLAIVPMFIIHFLNISDSHDRTNKLFFDKRIIFFILALIFFYLLGTPYTLFDFSEFKRDLLAQIKIFDYSGHPIANIGWIYHMKFSLFYGLGWPLFFVSLAGLVMLMKTNFKKALLLCSFPAVYYAVIGQVYGVVLRYAIPLIPFFCITGAVFTVYITDGLKKYLKPGLHKLTMYLIPILIISPSAHSILCFDDMLTRKDNRLVAAEWIKKNFAEGSSIAQLSNRSILGIYPTPEAMRQKYEMAASGNERVTKVYFHAKMVYTKTNNIRGFNVLSYDKTSKRFKSGLNQELIVFPDYVIVEESPLKNRGAVSKESVELLHNFYYLLKEFKAIDVNNKTNLFDQQDAFYVPFVGFKSIQRPGPNIYIYKRKEI